MEPPATYFLATILTGVVLLLGWLYATIDNPRSGTILGKSLLLFVLPMLVWPGSLFLRLPLGILLAAACEEGLKAFASTRERNREDKFWLVSLFGIWELTLDKPFRALIWGQSTQIWDRLTFVGHLYSIALPVLLHTVTAAIYAFTFERRLWAAFVVSCLIHMLFNAAVDQFGIAPVPLLSETLILSVILTALILGRFRRPASEGR